MTAVAVQAKRLKTRKALRRALLGIVVIGFAAAAVSHFRLAVWAPSAFALAADAVLLAFAFLARARRNYSFDR